MSTNPHAALGYDDARHAIDSAMSFARECNLRLSFAVVDAGGHIVAAARMDGAAFVTTEVARGKAYGCIATGGQSGRQLRDRYIENPNIWGNLSSLGYNTPLLPAIGSFPIWRDGQLIGAMGASGGSAELDEEAVTRAIRTIGADIRP